MDLKAPLYRARNFPLERARDCTSGEVRRDVDFWTYNRVVIVTSISLGGLIRDELFSQAWN